MAYFVASSSYVPISENLLKQMEIDTKFKTETQTHLNSDHEEDIYNLELRPHPENCNQLQLLQLAKTLHLLHQMLYKSFGKLMENDFDFYKNILMRPQIIQNYGKQYLEDKLNRAVLKVCKKLREMSIHQPSKLDEAIKLMKQMAHHPLLKSSVKQEISKTILKLKFEKQKLAHEHDKKPTLIFKQPPTPKPHPNAASNKTAKKAQHEMEEILDHFLKPKLLTPFR